jgi:hypothetical protein
MNIPLEAAECHQPSLELSLWYLAIAYLTMGHLGAAFRHVWQSPLIYHRLGVLSRQRMVSMPR